MKAYVVLLGLCILFGGVWSSETGENHDEDHEDKDEKFGIGDGHEGEFDEDHKTIEVPLPENEDDPWSWKQYYVRKIFGAYGVDISKGEQMGESHLVRLMLDIGLEVIHELVNFENGGGEDEHGSVDFNNTDHRRKRRDLIAIDVSDELHGQTILDINEKNTDIVSNVPHGHSAVTNFSETSCYTADRLLKEYNIHHKVTPTEGIGNDEFELLCPALVYTIQSRACLAEVHRKEALPPTAGEVWGWGLLSVTVISLLSFLGAALIPVIAAAFFETILSVLVASAVGALAGDALLHLLPHSQGNSHEHSDRGIYSNLTGLGGMYLLFVIEGIMKIMNAQKEKRLHKSSMEMNGKDKKKLPNKSTSSTRQLEDDFPNPDADGGENGSVVPHPEDVEIHEHGRHSHGHKHDHGDMKGKGVASVAWMVIAGDGMHNFSDGVAIGAAFSQSLVGGLSTSVAVFCHELPHELGDFAMLLKAGMSVKQALFYNAVAACIGYLGLVVGILIGKYASNVTPWIFAITAGMFLYVALVDMLPEINASRGGGSYAQMFFRFFLQNLGLVVGIIIMLMIALYEENIDFS